MRIIASIQARFGSSRLPGKVLKPIVGVPMLIREATRLRRSRLIDEVFVATTTSPADDAVDTACRAAGISVFRGSENDVLKRVADLLRKDGADFHAECYGDSPLVDAELVDKALTLLVESDGRLDLVSSALRTTYPPGLEAVCYRTSSLLEADKSVAPSDPLREHCALHLSRLLPSERKLSMEAEPRHHRPDLFLEVDEEADFRVVSAVFEHFLTRGEEYFTLDQILGFFTDHPELAAQNRGVERRWRQHRDDAR